MGRKVFQVLLHKCTHTYTHGMYIHICVTVITLIKLKGGSFKNMFNPAKTYTHPSLQPSNKSSVLLQETFWHQGRQYKGVMTKAEYIHSLAQVFSSSPADTLDLDKCLQRGLLCTL